jgi:hypothetical protein
LLLVRELEATVQKFRTSGDAMTEFSLGRSRFAPCEPDIADPMHVQRAGFDASRDGSANVLLAALHAARHRGGGSLRTELRGLLELARIRFVGPTFFFLDEPTEWTKRLGKFERNPAACIYLRVSRRHSQSFD